MPYLLLAASVATLLAWCCCAVGGRYDELSVEPRDRLREKRPDQQRLAVAVAVFNEGEG